MNFGDRVAEAVERKRSCLCVGLDPRIDLLPPEVITGLHSGASGRARAYERFCGGVIDAVADDAVAVKPQVAFFEALGGVGVSALERVCAHARDAGLLVVVDGKRGDIDSTAEAYADAWLGDRSPLAADAMTAHAYLGLAALLPLVRLAAATGRGVLVVARSSNPEGRSLQQAVTAGGPAVEDMLLGEIAALNGSPDVPAGTVGAVVGATLEPSVFPLSQLGGVILAPGLGAQGARPEDVAKRFAGCRPGTVLPSSSRALLTAGPDPVELRRRAAALVRELAAAMG